MYWLDYSPRKKRTPPWRGLLFLIILGASIFLVGALNDWWQVLSPESSNRTSMTDMAATDAAVIVLETEEPPAATHTPLPVAAVTAGAPDFTLESLFDDSSPISLSDYAGRPVILNFWASWCVPCREEMPALQNVYEQYQDDGLVLLGINQTYIDDLQAARDFVEELDLSFPSVRDDTGDVSEREYRVLGLPTTVFITAEGEIAYVQVGQLSQGQIAEYSQRLVAGEALNE